MRFQIVTEEYVYFFVKNNGVWTVDLLVNDQREYIGILCTYTLQVKPTSMALYPEDARPIRYINILLQEVMR